MNHFAGDDEAGLAGDEDDSAPIPRQHARQITTRKADPAHHIDFEIAPPVVVAGVRKAFAFIDAEIVDEDIDLGLGLQDRRRAGFRSGIGGDAGNILRAGCADAGDRGIELGAIPSGDDDVGAFDRQLPRDFEADAGGCSRHQRALTVQLHIHGEPLLSCCILLEK